MDLGSTRFPIRLAALSGLLFTQVAASAQTAPAIEWQSCIGGTDYDLPYALQLTPDGGYVIAGETRSYDGEFTGRPVDPFSNTDAFVVKLNSTGGFQQMRTMGQQADDRANSIATTNDGGYIMAGEFTKTEGGTGYPVGLVVKYSHTGAVQWRRYLGGAVHDWAYDAHQTADGGYIMAGTTSSSELPGFHGGSDAWVVKLDAAGNTEWQRCYGGSGGDGAKSLMPTADGGYIMAGTARSNDGDVSGLHGVNGNGDAWVVKLDVAGNIEWQRCLGGSKPEEAWAVRQTVDGGYILACDANSTNGDVTNHHGDGPWANTDAWVVKLDATGALQWEHALGGSRWDSAKDVQQTADGGYIMAGFTDSKDGDVTGKQGPQNQWDAWVVKLDGAGSLQWQRCLGGTSRELANAVVQTPDGGYVVACEASSNDGDVTCEHSYAIADAWVVKLAPDGTVPGMQPLGGSEGGQGFANNGTAAVKDLFLYPTITTGLVTLNWSRPDAVSVNVLDPLGRELESGQAVGNSHIIQLEPYENGVYMVQLLFADGNQVLRRVVKE